MLLQPLYEVLQGNPLFWDLAMVAKMTSMAESSKICEKKKKSKFAAETNIVIEQYHEKILQSNVMVWWLVEVKIGVGWEGIKIEHATNKILEE